MLLSMLIFISLIFSLDVFASDAAYYWFAAYATMSRRRCRLIADYAAIDYISAAPDAADYC